MPLVLPIVNECNQSCLFCSSGGRVDNVCIRYLSRLINGERDSVTVSGGEPTLSKNLFAILTRIHQKGLRVELQTNGVRLSSFQLANSLVRQHIELFNINFPSHLKSSAEALTQTPRSFEKRIKGIENLLKLKAKVRLTHVINALNYSALGQFIDFLHTHFPQITYVQFSFLKIMGSAKNNRTVCVDYQTVEKPLLDALKKCKSHNISFLIDHIPLCYLAGYRQYHADYIKIVSGMPLAYSLREKIKIAECRECRLSPFCCGVRKDYLDYFREKTRVRPVR